MTTHDWLTNARHDVEKLKDLLRAYHPTMLRGPLDTLEDRRRYGLHITAPAAEAACEAVREDVRKNFEGDPVTQLDEALAADDVGKVISLLNQAWFGVPESSSCWNIPGFREAVALLEEPPDDDTSDTA